MAATIIQIRCRNLVIQETPGRAVVDDPARIFVCQIIGTIKSQGRGNGKQSGYVAGMLSISGS
jgi:hypothetical protein